MFIWNLFCCAQAPVSQALTQKVYPVRKTSKVSVRVSDENASPQTQNPETFKNEKQNIYERSTHSIPSGVQNKNENNSPIDNGEFPSGQVSLASIQNENFDSPLTNQVLTKCQSDSALFRIQNENLSGLQFIDTEVRKWSVKNVLKFLGKVGLGNYQNAFYENKVKGKDLITLSQKELERDLQMKKCDVKILGVYLQFLKENAKRDRKQKQLSKSTKLSRRPTFNSLNSNLSSGRKFFNMVKNPIIEQSEQQYLDETCRAKENFYTKDRVVYELNTCALQFAGSPIFTCYRMEMFLAFSSCNGHSGVI